MRMGKMIVVLGLLAAVAMPANAAYWTDNFDTGETVGNTPVNWTVWGTASATSLISTEDVYSSPNAVKQYDNDSDSQVSMFRYFTESESGTLSLDFKNPAAYFYVILFDGTKTNVMTQFAFYYNDWSYNDGGVTESSGNHNPWITHWSKLTVEWTGATDTTTGTYSVTVADLEATNTLTFAGLAFDNVGSAGCLYLKTGIGWTTEKTTYIDNVVVPEPATLVLLGLGGVGLLIRRRRR